MSEEKNKVELPERVKQFNAELIPLLGKYKLGLGAIPLILPDGRIAAKPQLFEDKVEEKSEPAPEAKPEGNGLAAA